MAAETDLKACAPPPRHFRWWLAMSVLLVAAAPSQAMEDIWSRLPRGLPADSLGSALQRLESAGPAPVSAAAAFAEGEFHHARGEYRLAAEAFGRAAARLQGLEHTVTEPGEGVGQARERLAASS